MPYKPTGRLNGRPRKNPMPDQEPPVREKVNRRVRKEFKQPPSRRYVSAAAPVAYVEPVDMTPPGFGQRKRVKLRRPSLRPTPLKA